MARAGVGKLVGGQHPVELVSLGAYVTVPRSEDVAGMVVTDDDLPCGTRGRLSEPKMNIVERSSCPPDLMSIARKRCFRRSKASIGLQFGAEFAFWHGVPDAVFRIRKSSFLYVSYTDMRYAIWYNFAADQKVWKFTNPFFRQWLMRRGPL